MTVTELTDQYVAGEIDGEERERMERYFFRSPERQARLNIARGLKDERAKWKRPRARSNFALPIAAGILLMVGVSYTLWTLTRETALERGMIALQGATLDRRPVESRLVGLAYAPFSQTRGPQDNDPREAQLRLAELHLQQALKDEPSPEVHHGLGQVYLARKDFDTAIKHLDQAATGAPSNSLIYSDLGAAWLEKAKAGPDAKDELARSIENLNKALQLDNNLLEARFNRALAYEYQQQTDRAKEDWREYLKHDSTSQWADEARRHLQLLESNAIVSPN